MPYYTESKKEIKTAGQIPRILPKFDVKKDKLA
jgi:ribosomal protein L31